MDIGRLKIEVFMSFVVMVTIMVYMFIVSSVIMPLYAMSMIPIMSENKGTDYIDNESYYSNNKGNVVVYTQRGKESFYRKSCDKKPHNTEKDSTCICSEYFYLPGSKGKLGIPDIFTSKYISKK